MKKYLFKIFVVIPASAFSIGGFGLNIPYSSFVVDQSSSDLKVDIIGQMEKVGQIDRFGFENAYGFGGYLYLDIIPFIDIDVDINLIGNLYDFYLFIKLELRKCFCGQSKFTKEFFRKYGISNAYCRSFVIH